MSPILGNLVVILILAVIVGLCVRSLWRSHKHGGGCGGDCSHCGGCHGEQKTEGSCPH